MKFLILAAFVAASSAAGFKASIGDLESLNGKRECVAKAIENSTDQLSKSSDELLKILKKNSAFNEIVGEIQYLRDGFLQILEMLREETNDFNALRFAQKVMQSIPDFVQLSVRAAALIARIQLIPTNLATRETAELAAEAYAPFVRLGSLVGDLATQIETCI